MDQSDVYSREMAVQLKKGPADEKANVVLAFSI
jgi:hypothetical protein